MNPQDYTIVQLKELLKAKDLSVMGNKTDLILRYKNRHGAGRRYQKPKEKTKTAASEQAEADPALRGIKCFNYKERGHRATECAKSRVAASKPTDAQPNESAGKTSKAANEANLIQPFVRSEPYTVLITYTGHITKVTYRHFRA
ncbi:hypothetical protein ALC57_16844 [Trachymyrmex cornetzi]|uniref:SAP domain-containing protein n=1 Tax=Trachymyrmex cornetzi TaxID=471704 RepID=A0A151IUG0_9HYME|nr:hypothetical protein ALC57_16844 [Trachymyrmex cornetzi]